jgi:hypothetical protein
LIAAVALHTDRAVFSYPFAGVRKGITAWHEW